MTRVVRLGLILAIAIVIRVGYLRTVGHSDLLTYNVAWAEAIRSDGLFQIYAQQASANYPPLYMALLGTTALFGQPSSPDFLILLKLTPLISELALIAVVTIWLAQHSERLAWLIPLLLALHPGLIATTAFWGQVDALLVVLLVLTLVVLNRQRAGWAWLFFTLALLAKFQAVVLLPLLAILTWQRCGWRRSITYAGLSGAAVLVVLLPFIAGSGLSNAQRPYAGAVDFYPTTTVNAFNFWHILNPSVWGDHLPLLYTEIPDTQPIIAGLSAKIIGFALLGVYTLAICIVIWRHYRESREWVWATALYFGFFMLPTQIHERYLYPAVIFSLIAIAQDRRMWPVALGLILTYSYNVVVPSHAPFYWLGINELFWLGDVTLPMALLNAVLFGLCAWIAFTLPEMKMWRGARVIIGVAALLLIGVIFARVIVPERFPANATPLDVRLGESIRLEGYSVAEDAVTLYWRALAHHNDDYTIFVHAVGPDGQMIDQTDERPQGGAYPSWRWYHNRLIATTFTLDLANTQTLYTGLYRANVTPIVNLPVIQNGQSAPDGRAIVCGNCLHN